MSWYCPECGTEVTSGKECHECGYVDEGPEEEEDTDTSSGGFVSKLKTGGKIMIYLTVGMTLLMILVTLVAFGNLFPFI
ncbi:MULTISPECIES: hypothetical protein [Halorubrum]|uniref:hypothetical protein n=1 Tax=Halorubrum TaxID=56688 RepID=UPI0010F871E3|nr:MULTISPECIES: hypothetical protein [Halorubrum]TKX67915.1 hypothetical protein EXE40_13875 [Halorubrum sp. GN11GM_10-3_MGM]